MTTPQSEAAEYNYPSIEHNGEQWIRIVDHLNLVAATRAKERERFPTTMPRSVSITIVANDGVEQEAIRKVLTLEQISRSSGVVLKLLTEDAIRAIVESKIITQAIANPIHET